MKKVYVFFADGFEEIEGFRKAIRKLPLVVLQNEVAIETQEVIRHQISVVRRGEDLAIHVEQQLAYFKRQLEMIESVKFINKDKRSNRHLLNPHIKQFQGFCPC